MTPDLTWLDTARTHYKTVERLAAAGIPAHAAVRRNAEQQLLRCQPYLFELIDLLVHRVQREPQP